MGKSGWDVIPFNWGLHDLKCLVDDQPQVDLAQYERNLGRLVMRLRQAGARRIGASTTPAPGRNISTRRIPENVPRYHAAALPMMQKNKVSVNDRNAHALPRLGQIQTKDNVRLTDGGSRAPGARVAEAVRGVTRLTKRWEDDLIRAGGDEPAGR